MSRAIPAFLLLAISVGGGLPTLKDVAAAGPEEPAFARDIAPLLRRYCLACHDSREANGDLTMETLGQLRKGGEHGASLVAGKPEESLLFKLMERKAEPFMPPDGQKAPSAAEMELIRRWIAAGAKGADADRVTAPTLDTPKIAVRGAAVRPIRSLAISPNGRWIAIGRHGAVEILDGNDRRPLKTLEGLTGAVNALAFSKDSSRLAAGAGETGLAGEASLWKTETWEKSATLRGHEDAIYAIDVSPDSKQLATGSYDQKILLWDLATEKPVRELAGHHGSVNAVAFHPQGRFLVSASSDRTVKLWSLESGTRLDTFGQPEKDQNAVAFSPDGRYVVAGGADNRLRIWRLDAKGIEGASPLVYSRFAHEGPILRTAFSLDGKLLATSGEDRTVKLWETGTFTPLQVQSGESDWPTAIAFTHDRQRLLVGRLDGSFSDRSLRDLGPLARAEVAPILRDVVPEVSLKTPAPLPSEATEKEPNDVPGSATPLSAPAVVQGTLFSQEANRPDVDLFRWTSRAGQVWVLETNASRRNSPADTRIEVLQADGKPVLRHLLRAVRASWIEFRPIDSSQDQVRVKNWEEMDLNQFLYMNGEVGKFLKAPEGPDSGFWFYTIGGKRRTYFDTTPTIHPLDAPCYIVEAYPPGTTLVDNGLPVFPLSYANDDDGERKLGSDSRLTFTAPADGDYLVKVTDARGFSGKEFAYSLAVRAPRPDFAVTVGGKTPTIPKGSAQRLTFTVDRIDGYDGAVRIDIADLPPGFVAATPVHVEAGHVEARGMIHAAADAAPPSKDAWEKVRVTATATVVGEEMTKDLGHLGELKLAEKPKVLVTLLPDPANAPSTSDGEPEIVITPGQRTTALVRIERNGASGDLRFDVDNLPHGVIVDDLGLNGITLLPGQTERRIFIAARDWVPESSRMIYAISRSEGNQASLPVRFRVQATQK